MRWRWLHSGDAGGAEQMAVDVGLADRARATGEATLRVYGWARPTLSFGRHEAVRARFDAATLAHDGVDAVRRPTGGRVLLHEGEVTYSVTAPADPSERLRDSFARINALLQRALARLGVTAHASQPDAGRPTMRPGRDACFAVPSAGELVVSNRKLVASAQLRDTGALLQHGSILLEDRQPRIAALASVPMNETAPGATLRAALGRIVEPDEVHAALRGALELEVGPVEPLDPAEAATFAASHRARFLDPEWTWRR